MQIVIKTIKDEPVEFQQRSDSFCLGWSYEQTIQPCLEGLIWKVMEIGEREQFPAKERLVQRLGSGGVQATVKHKCTLVGSALEGMWV